MRLGMIVGAALAMKHQKKLAKHVKGGQAGGDKADGPENVCAVAEGLPEN